MMINVYGLNITDNGFLASVAESSVVLPPVTQGSHRMTNRKIPLRLVTAPAVGVVLEAPPVLKASDHSVDSPAAIAAWFCYTPRRAKFVEF